MKITHNDNNPINDWCAHTDNELLLMLWIEQKRRHISHEVEIQHINEHRAQIPDKNAGSNINNVVSLQEFLDKKKEAI